LPEFPCFVSFALSSGVRAFALPPVLCNMAAGGAPRMLMLAVSCWFCLQILAAAVLPLTVHDCV
jgi:hypothetical protein